MSTSIPVNWRDTMSVCFDGIYKKEKKLWPVIFLVHLFCFTSSLCHGFCFIPLGHTSLCVFTVNFWFSDYTIFSEEVWLLNQGKKESFESLEISVLIFMKYQKKRSYNAFVSFGLMTLLLLEILAHTEGMKEISQQLAKLSIW